MKTRFCALAFLLVGLAGCATPYVSSGLAMLSPERISAIVANPDRSAADQVNDQRRKPEQMLAFIGVRAGMAVLDISAGGGYTTELLARATGPSGVVYGQSAPRSATAATPAAPEGNSGPPAASAASPTPGPRRSSPEALADRQNRLSAAGAAAPIIAVVQAFEDPAPPERKSLALDLATLMFNYHDLGFLGVDRAQMNRAVFAALKPGAIYVIADHAGRAGTGISESGTLHRIEEAFLVKEVEAAGFRFVGEGGFLRNPADPRDRNTPEPAQPKDDFVLKFVRP